MKQKLKWEPLNDGYPVSTYRMKVPGGWMILVTSHTGLALSFSPDARHIWDLKPG